MRRILAVLIAVPLSAATLADLKATSAQLRAQQSHPAGWRGESPPLTRFKHELRNWVEVAMTDAPDDHEAVASA